MVRAMNLALSLEGFISIWTKRQTPTRRAYTCSPPRRCPRVDCLGDRFVPKPIGLGLKERALRVLSRDLRALALGAAHSGVWPKWVSVELRNLLIAACNSMALGKNM